MIPPTPQLQSTWSQKSSRYLNPQEAWSQVNTSSGIDELLGSLCALFIALLFLVLVVAMCGYEVYLFHAFQNKECEQLLPLWCGIEGISGLVWIVLHAGIANLCPGGEKDAKDGICLKRTEWVVNAYNIALFIWGAVMIYSVNPNDYVCPHQVFDFMWVLYIVLWVLMGLALVIGICCCLFLSANNNIQ